MQVNKNQYIVILIYLSEFKLLFKSEGIRVFVVILVGCQVRKQVLNIPCSFPSEAYVKLSLYVGQVMS